MKLIFLVFLFSLNCLAAPKYSCGEKLVKKLNSVKVTSVKDMDAAQLEMIRGIPCLGNKDYKAANVAVFKLYTRMVAVRDFTEEFEILFPYYDRYKEFFEKEILVELTEKERKVINRHYNDTLFLIRNGNG